MASIANTQVKQDDGTILVTWTPLTEADTGLGAALARHPDRTVQVIFASGSGTVRIEGSNDGSNWGALSDHANETLDITDATPRLIAQNPRYLRPRATSGTFSAHIYILAAPR